MILASLSYGEIVVVIFVGIAFSLGIYFGVRLLRRNMADHRRMMEENERKRKAREAKSATE